MTHWLVILALAILVSGCDLNARTNTQLKELQIAQSACASEKGTFTFVKKWTHGDWGWPYYEWNCSRGGA